jgi:hypothetical protein
MLRIADAETRRRGEGATSAYRRLPVKPKLRNRRTNRAAGDAKAHSRGGYWIGEPDQTARTYARPLSKILPDALLPAIHRERFHALAEADILAQSHYVEGDRAR